MQKQKITLIHGTNRPDSMSMKVAKVYAERLRLADVEFSFFSLRQLPVGMFDPETMYIYNKHEGYHELQEKYIVPAEKFIFVVPEYNGSFPGIFKTFIDASDIPRCFHNKKACLVGVAAGRAGNLRGMDHLTNIFNHMKMTVLPLKIPISSVNKVVDDEGQITVEETIKLLDTQIKQFIEL